MLTDIFSSFDPMLIFPYPSPFFWPIALLLLIPIFSAMWLTKSRTWGAAYWAISIMIQQVSRTNSTNLQGAQMILPPLFIFLITLNLSGLIPYVFSLTSHLIFTLSFGLPLWLSMILSGISLSPSSFLAGLSPSGAPNMLTPFLVLTETLSITVRPITLSFRLTANMTAGHVVLGLIGIYTCVAMLNLSYSLLPLMFIHMGYTLFEVGIALIQAYIFCLLLTLYADDHPSH